MSTNNTTPVLFITGASKGIGFEIAKQFLAEGYRVINLSRSPAPDKAIENFKIDLSQADADEKVAEIVSKTLHPDTSSPGTSSPENTQLGKICLVHNAAILLKDSAISTTNSSFQKVIDLNLIAPHILNQHLIPLMKPGSSIIYIGSTLSEKAVANTYSYVVSKHAIVGMMRATCQDLAGTAIHTACICPGFTDTEMLRSHTQFDAKLLKEIGSMSTFNRLIAPEEIARTVKFAAQNPVINGSVLHANLGQIER